MSQLVETRVNDFLGEGVSVPATIMPRPTPAPMAPSAPRPTATPSISSTPAPKTQETAAPSARPSTPAVPMTSAAARFAVDPPPPIIKQKQDTNAPKPAEKRPDQIFTF
ncbi:MAG TPA: hypothetical protein VGM39_04795 [Kofleriaceae bacterium]